MTAINSDMHDLGRYAAPPLTRHARQRLKDRSIPQFIVDGLIDFGERRPAGGGCEICFFSKRAWRRFSTNLGTEARHFDKYRKAYVVVAQDDLVVTACWCH